MLATAQEAKRSLPSLPRSVREHERRRGDSVTERVGERGQGDVNKRVLEDAYC